MNKSFLSVLGGFILLICAQQTQAQTDSLLTTSKAPLINKSGQKTVLDELNEKKNKIKEAFSSKENLKKAALSGVSAGAGLSSPLGDLNTDGLPSDLGLKVLKSRKKNKKTVNKFSRNEYEGIAVTRIANRLGSGDKVTVEEFYVLKAYQAPSVYVRDIHWFDYRAHRILVTPIKDKDYAQILHGPYRRFKGEHLEEEGYYYMGTKHGRWEKYGRDVDGDEGLMDKQSYDKGFPAESEITYYDAAKTKIKEVIPRMHGHYTGLYRSFYEGGQLKEEGNMDDSVRVKLWREYHQFGSGSRTKRDIQYGADKYEAVEGVVLREYDNRGKLIYENKNKGKKEEEQTTERF
ncbi:MULTISPECIES: toxin-antitoxin system YwqK family antitoxin [unclassified Siphonobacter]|uniref:toxin-antitoxin system YwqK family antitoxin n=1 Tax=unclassified Siphonobacter TaxID=2635712 RepID=UPI00278BA44B|nr:MULTISPECIES: hypothetical protein [unclassified Siphonobacter]MDQ1086794.1 hypothetical protein [Siphonobacter sp. SORGH_AS_1065]MDR6197046.1 hypothetical protein [Siphonobacter sp. SORGH_AS_0500]